MAIEESGLVFDFKPDTRAVKFDDMPFYRERFNHLPGGKGVDILTDSGDEIQLIEVKNCTGHEVENLWRTSVNDSKIDSAPGELDTESRHSLDIEVTQKVAATLACLLGAGTKRNRENSAEELAKYCDSLTGRAVYTDKKPVYVILFLEGDFSLAGSKSRNKRMIMKRIQESLAQKLDWMNCRVVVVDSSTYNRKHFTVHT